MTEIAVAIAAFGWIAAAVLFGLYLGEKGRRLDVQWVMGTLRSQAAPSVQATESPEERALGAVAREEKAAIEEALRAELESEGRSVSPKRLEEEVERIYSELSPTYGGTSQ